jgi:hypothetical protein
MLMAIVEPGTHVRHCALTNRKTMVAGGLGGGAGSSGAVQLPLTHEQSDSGMVEVREVRPGLKWTLSDPFLAKEAALSQWPPWWGRRIETGRSSKHYAQPRQDNVK